MNKRRSSRRIPRRRNNRRRLTTMLTGRVRTAPIAPRAGTLSPWNSILLQRTVTVADSTSFTITPSYLRDVLISQLQFRVTGTGSTNSTVFNIRPISVEFHDMAGRPIQGRLNDYVNSSLGATATGISYPSRAGYSRLKLYWPKVVSSTPLSVSAINQSTVIISGSVGTPTGNTIIAGTSLLVKIFILWKTGDITPPTVLDAPTFQVTPNGDTLFDADSASKSIVIDEVERLSEENDTAQRTGQMNPQLQMT